MKTIEYEVWYITLEDNLELHCADNHIVFTTDKQIFVKDLKVNDFIQTRYGLKKVLTLENLGYLENMYDIEVDSIEHEYYSNDIISHNTTTSAAYLCYELCFNTDLTIAILANKASTSIEILDRVKNMLEDLPWFLKPGVKEWNKTSIELEDRRKVVAAATSASSIRGLSINILLLDEFAHITNDVEFYTSTYPVISSGDSTKVIIYYHNFILSQVFNKLNKSPICISLLLIFIRVSYTQDSNSCEKFAVLARVSFSHCESRSG